MIYIKKKIGIIVTLYLLVFLSFTTLPVTGITFKKAVNPINLENCEDKVEYWALIVGVGEYADWPSGGSPDMNAMKRQANDIYKDLISKEDWSEDHIRLLIGEEATAPNIIKGLRWLDKMDDENDISLVMISTHGGNWKKDIPPIDEKDGKDEFLMTYWSCPFALSKNMGRMIWDDEFNLLLSRLDSQGICLIVLSCHSGYNDSVFFEGKDVIKNMRKTSFNHDNFSPILWSKDFVSSMENKGRVIITACKEDETSFSSLGNYFVDAMRGYADIDGNNIISAEEIFDYIKQRASLSFTPTIYDGYSGELPLIKINGSQTSAETLYNNSLNKPDIIKNDDADLENSIICGFIKDALSKEPIENARVLINGDNNHNDTYSDSNGFYSINVKKDEGNLIFSADCYLRKIKNIHIGENEILWANISLNKILYENSTICGFIRDSLSEEPIEDALIMMSWEDDQGQYYQNYTISDSNGFYKINSIPGKIIMAFGKINYFVKRTDYFLIEENETFWFNISLDKMPPKNSIVCGYITDSTTDLPVEIASIDLSWYNDQGYSDDNSTYTDCKGFYKMNVREGNVFVNSSKMYYFDNYSEEHLVNQDDVVWINLTLNPTYGESVKVCGYVKSEKNNEPIRNATIYFRHFLGENEYYFKESQTDFNGFYITNMLPGEVIIRISGGVGKHLDYEAQFLYRHDAIVGEKLWVNASLKTKDIELVLNPTLKGIFRNGERILPYSKTIIFGDIEIRPSIYSLDNIGFNTTRVEFYLNGELVLNKTIEDTKYISWRWEKGKLLRHRHLIKIVAYGENGRTATKEITVWRFL